MRANPSNLFFQAVKADGSRTIYPIGMGKGTGYFLSFHAGMGDAIISCQSLNEPVANTSRACGRVNSRRTACEPPEREVCLVLLFLLTESPFSLDQRHRGNDGNIESDFTPVRSDDADGFIRSLVCLIRPAGAVSPDRLLLKAHSLLRCGYLFSSLKSNGSVLQLCAS